MKLKSLILMIYLLAAAGGLLAQNKTALLIANGSYDNFGNLANPVPEARQLRSVLQDLGFQVTLITNASKEDMVIGLRNFKRSVQSRGGIAFFHYGGHAVQVDGRNYLLPSNADIPNEDYVDFRAMNADEIMVSMEQSGSSTNIIVLDSCRNNPLPASSGRSAARGLARSNLEPPNSVIVYSAKSGQEAQDGVFTPALIQALKTPGLSLDQMLKQVRRQVHNQTGGLQTPGEYNQLFETVYLSPAGHTTSGGNTISFGDVTVEPGSLSVSVKEAGILTINGQRVQIPAGGNLPINGLDPGTYALSIRYNDGHTESKNAQVESGLNRSIIFSYSKQQQVPNGFVLVKAGTFSMGSPANEEGRFDNESQHQVRISRDFYMAETEVTQGMWEEVMGSNHSESTKGIGANYPVNKVSWNDAVEFCNKLSRRDGLTPCYSGSGNTITCNFNADGYRLPTEAEWEYAARGGHKAGRYQLYAGSNNIGNVGWDSGSSGGKNHLVAGKMANSLGLYDMTGNVWEWCWDWYGSYNGNTTDPVGAESGSRRVIRGGSWYSIAKDCRIARRLGINPDDRDSSSGFRLVRTAVH